MCDRYFQVRPFIVNKEKLSEYVLPKALFKAELKIITYGNNICRKALWNYLDCIYVYSEIQILISHRLLSRLLFTKLSVEINIWLNLTKEISVKYYITHICSP